MTKWWHLAVEEIARTLGTDGKAGLSEAAAAEKLITHGANELLEKKGRGPLAIFLDQFKGLIIWVLIGAALVSGFLKEWVDALAILAIVILNAVLGLAQEYRAEKSLAALKKLSAKADLMAWSYAADPFAGLKRSTLDRFKSAGVRVWGASAFKGGDGPLVDLPDVTARARNTSHT